MKTEIECKCSELGYLEHHTYCPNREQTGAKPDLDAILVEAWQLLKEKIVCGESFAQRMEKEQGRWQEEIYGLVCKQCPTASIDGKGCESGDPLDVTLSEVGQGLAHWIDNHEAIHKQLSELIGDHLALKAKYQSALESLEHYRESGE